MLSDVLGHPNVAPVQLQESKLLRPRLFAQDQADRRFFSRFALMLVQPAQVNSSCPLCEGSNSPSFNSMATKTAQLPMVQQIKVEVLAVNDHALLPGYECKTIPHFQQERLDLP